MTQYLNVLEVHDSEEFLYELLKERKDYMNISHKKMPTWDEHCRFVSRHPYKAWYIIEDGGVRRGSIYLTKDREVGIFILAEYNGMGYGAEALQWIEDKYGLPIYANISVRNHKSMAFFDKRGYRRLQETWIKDSCHS